MTPCLRFIKAFPFALVVAAFTKVSGTAWSQQAVPGNAPGRVGASVPGSAGDGVAQGASGGRPVYPVDPRSADLQPRVPGMTGGEPGIGLEITGIPLNRNPGRRGARGPDVAPPADVRNSTERPTGRAAPGPDARDTVVVPDPSRDTVPPQPGAIR